MGRISIGLWLLALSACPALAAGECFMDDRLLVEKGDVRDLVELLTANDKWEAGRANLNPSRFVRAGLCSRVHSFTDLGLRTSRALSRKLMATSDRAASSPQAQGCGARACANGTVRSKSESQALHL